MFTRITNSRLFFLCYENNELEKKNVTRITNKKKNVYENTELSRKGAEKSLRSHRVTASFSKKQERENRETQARIPRRMDAAVPARAWVVHLITRDYYTVFSLGAGRAGLPGGVRWADTGSCGGEGGATGTGVILIFFSLYEEEQTNKKKNGCISNSNPPDIP